LAGFDQAVISLYGKGMTTGDVASHLSEVYDTHVSRDLVSRVTDQVLKDMRAWQSRPLDPVYPVILIDAIVLKVRSGTVANRPVYVAMGITLNGERDVLGMWVGPTGGEGAKQWMNMLTDLKNRGILDVCIVACEGLRGLPDAILATWPQATVQTCVVHLVRNSLRYASKKYWSQVTTDLRKVYTAPSLEAAEDAFEVFAKTWEPKYPAMVAMWRRSWAEFMPFHDFPVEVRKLIYTTNGIESLNARFRAATRRRGHFPDEEAALKVLYLAVLQREKNRPNPTGQISGWKNILNVLSNESALPGGTATGEEQAQPDRPNQRLEEHPERPIHDLRRPPRHQLATCRYTKFLTLPVRAEREDWMALARQRSFILTMLSRRSELRASKRWQRK
jgi:transposase-like protein